MRIIKYQSFDSNGGILTTPSSAYLLCTIHGLDLHCFLPLKAAGSAGVSKTDNFARTAHSLGQPDNRIDSKAARQSCHVKSKFASEGSFRDALVPCFSQGNF